MSLLRLSHATERRTHRAAPARTARRGDRPVQVRIRVRGRYEPDRIVARAGDRLRLVFRREESAACSERVVFPDFGKSATLPTNEDVAIDLHPQEPGEYDFTCAMGMLRGRLIVTAADVGDEPGRF